MQTIHAGNMKKSAFMRSQLEACKIGQKVKKKIFLKKPFSTSIFEVLSNPYRLSLSKMAGCKRRCALKEEKREREKEEKRKGKRRKKWRSIVFFFFLSPCACFFICAVIIFRIYKENCI